MQIILTVLSGAHEGKQIPIKDEKFLIGRSDSCQLRPKSESISRKHCAIVQKEGRVLLVDLKSRNGTFVNDKQLVPEKAKILKTGDKIRCGQLVFEITIEVGIANSKQPEVANVKEAAERMSEQGFDSKESFDISSWLLEADQIDRTAPAPTHTVTEEETRQFTMEDTTRVEATQIQEEGENAPEEATTRRPEKKAPMKLPKMNTGPTTKTTKDAASETLKKYFGGRA